MASGLPRHPSTVRSETGRCSVSDWSERWSPLVFESAFSGAGNSLLRHCLPKETRMVPWQRTENFRRLCLSRSEPRGGGATEIASRCDSRQPFDACNPGQCGDNDLFFRTSRPSKGRDSHMAVSAETGIDPAEMSQTIHFAAFTGVSLSPSRRNGSRVRFPSAGFVSRTQMLRNRTGLPWSCKRIGCFRSCFV